MGGEGRVLSEGFVIRGVLGLGDGAGGGEEGGVWGGGGAIIMEHIIEIRNIFQ